MNLKDYAMHLGPDLRSCNNLVFSHTHSVSDNMVWNLSVHHGFCFGLCLKGFMPIPDWKAFTEYLVRAALSGMSHLSVTLQALSPVGLTVWWCSTLQAWSMTSAVYWIQHWLLLLLLSVELLSQRCRTDDLAPNIPDSSLLPCSVDSKVQWLNVLVNCSQPGDSWVSGWSPPVGWWLECSGYNAVVILLWGCSSQVSEESQAVGLDHFRDWWAASDVSNCLVCGVPGIWYP